MPEICRFLGISIRMFRDDHAPPHFHAVYNEFAAQISIRPPAILNGKLPPRVLGFIIEWALFHQEELMHCWQAAHTDAPIGKIEPLI